MNLLDSSQDSLNGGSARHKASTYTWDNAEKRWRTSMPRMGFEPTIPVFERPRSHWNRHD